MTGKGFGLDKFGENSLKENLIDLKLQ